MKEQGSSTVVAVAAIVALVLGGGVGYAVGMNADDSGSSNSEMSVMEPTAPASDLRVGLNNLLREHVSSSLDVTRLISEGAPQAELDGALAAQAANGGDIAAAVGSVYGEEAQGQITELFVDHIEESNNYAMAVASGDEAARAAAQEELNEYLRDISAFFSGAINDLPEDTVYGLLEEHENLLNQSVVAYDEGNFEQSYQLERDALTQVNTIADALASGIVATKPDMFTE